MNLSPIARRPVRLYALQTGLAGLLGLALVLFGVLAIEAQFHEAHCSHEGPDCQMDLVLMGKKAILVAPVAVSALPTPVPAFDGLVLDESGEPLDPGTLTPYRRGPPSV
ncbi:MAG: hypothetical protein GY851_14460 [bacterium]|nr:hypothetical protein [bacterium]